MIFSKLELKTLWPFYAQSLVQSMSKVIMPFYVLYFLSIGLNFFQIAMIGAVRSVISILFEIPTGAIADIYGRKISVIIGYLLMGISTVAVIFTKDFYLILVIFGLNALFETMVSGADSAWAVDLAEKHDNGLVDKYFLKRRVFKNIGMVVAPLAAGLVVAQYNMSNLWIIYGIGILVSVVFLLFGEGAPVLPEEDEDDEVLEANAFKNIFNQSDKTWQFIKKHSVLSLMFFAIFIFFIVEEITSLVWTPYLQNIGISLSQIGYIFSAIAALGVVTPLLVEKLLQYRSKYTVLITTTIIYGLALLLAAIFSKPLFVIILFMLTYNLEEVIEPLEEAITNSYIKSKVRATALSLKSVIISLASIVGGPIAGYLLGVISMQSALLLSGFLFLAIPVIYIVARRKTNNLPKLRNEYTIR